MIFYTLEGLLTVVSEYELETMLNEKITPGSEAMKTIASCLERAKKITLELLGTSADRVLAGSQEEAPMVVQECIEVMAALFLTSNSSAPKLKENLRNRLQSAKNLLADLRNSTVAPAKNPQRILFGSGENRL
jgi:F420-0:gamma-glutamyl ligase